MTFVYEITILLFNVGALLIVATLFYNNLTFFCQIFLFLTISRTIVMCLDYFKEESLNTFESTVLILLSTYFICSMFLMMSAYDLIVMYLIIKFQSL
jgi:NADH:ubiquinone oxidoreductase subunit 2 (subunit N)